MVGEIATTTNLEAYSSGDAQTLIDQAIAEVRRFCGWHITPVVTEDVTVDGSGHNFVSLPSLHVTAVNSVTEDGTVLDAGSYEWSATGQLWRPWPWSGHFRAIAANITHGFDEVPQDVRAIVLAVAARAQVSPDGVVRRQAGAVSESYSQTGFNVAGGVSLVPHEKEALARYKL
jgi:hypothetical protein